jgi:hypothetical protein
MVPAARVADLVGAFEGVARSSGGEIAYCPLSVRIVGRAAPVVLTAERVTADQFQIRADVALAPAGSHSGLSTRTVLTIDALTRSLRGCARVRMRDGTLTIFLDGSPHPDVVAGVAERVLSATAEVADPELSQATPYRDSPESARARAA